MSDKDLKDDLANDHEFEMRQDAAEMSDEQKSFNNEEPPDCIQCERTGICYPGCIDAIGINPFKIGEPTGRIIKALRIARDYGPAQGSEHKAYAMDQMVRALTGGQYEDFKKTIGIWDEGRS